MTDPDKCKHPLKYKVTDDIRFYCPDCGRYLYDSKYYMGVDPAMGEYHSVVSLIHPDGTIEHLNRKYLRHLVDEVWNTVTESDEVPSTKWADEIIDFSLKNFPNDLEK